jgi:hypothetical protein
MRHGAVTPSLAFLVAMACPAIAIAADLRPTSIWYRGSDGCPDGAEFLGRLDSRGVHARLARVGDPIDFVVTLGSGPDGARGLLERQTETKTVAIRQLDGGSCDQVADAIALSLVVANTPHTEADAVPTRAPADAPEAAPASVVPVAATKDAVVATPSGERSRWALGVQGGVFLGVAPETLLASNLFVELVLPSVGVLRHPAVRVAAVEAQSVTSGSRRVGVFVAGGRLEACPLRLGTDAVSVSPCASLALGSIRTAGAGPAGITDHGLWGAIDVGGRLTVRVADPVAIEAALEAAIPLERYDFLSESAGTAYRTAAVGLNAGIGASVRLP